MSVVEKVVLVSLVTLDALQPALDGVHRLQHGAEVVMYREVAAQRAAGAHDRLLLWNRALCEKRLVANIESGLPSMGAGRACQNTWRPTWS